MFSSPVALLRAEKPVAKTMSSVVGFESCTNAAMTLSSYFVRLFSIRFQLKHVEKMLLKHCHRLNRFSLTRCYSSTAR